MHEPASLMDQLTNILERPPSSIEILPDDYEQAGPPDGHRAITPFLFIEGNLGVPKKALYRTYVDALVIFASAKKSAFGEEKQSLSAVRKLVASSAVILLANPGHLTALNARKRLIQRRLLEPKRELEYIAALLSSRNCANQSILWHHRQWLLRRIYGSFDDTFQHTPVDETLLQVQTGSNMEVPSSIMIPREVIDNELLIASKACEIYPRNYFAWTHRHFCIQLVIYSLNSGTGATNLEELAMLISDEVATMRRWIEQHISDSSAVHYLVALLHRLSDAGLMDVVPPALPNSQDRSTPDAGIVPICAGDFSSSISHAISLVQSYPDHESLWVYLRAVSCQGKTQSDDIEKFSRSFIYPWACQSQLPSGYDSKPVTIYAYRFLAWQAYQAGCLILHETDSRDIIAADPHNRPTPGSLGTS